MASTGKFGLSFSYISCDGIRDVFVEVERQRADYGVVPVENSNEGVVNHTLDMFVDSELKICGEILLEINHSLLSKQTDISLIRKVFSHHQTIAQTRKWLREHLPKADIVEVSSNARAAELAAESPSSGAIASQQAAEIYDLNVVSERIEDNANNITRFLVTGLKAVSPSGNDKTSIMFSARDKVGALCHLLEPFSRNRVNLTKIESRPLKRKPWEYFFFLDMQGHLEDEPVKRSLAELKEEASTFKILGSYPAADFQTTHKD
ncbi:MAG: prephenate dehydratase [bacterium]